jgi:hypothetical protein
MIAVDPVRDEELKDAHKHSSDHRIEVLASDSCGCFYCLASFPPSEIKEWIDGGQTALCPRCGIDSVLGSSRFGAGLGISPTFLAEMHELWFGRRYWTTG